MSLFVTLLSFFLIYIYAGKSFDVALLNICVLFILLHAHLLLFLHISTFTQIFIINL